MFWPLPTTVRRQCGTLSPDSVSLETVFLAPGVQKQVRVNHTDAIITAFDQSGVHQLPHNPADVSFVQAGAGSQSTLTDRRFRIHEKLPGYTGTLGAEGAFRPAGPSEPVGMSQVLIKDPRCHNPRVSGEVQPGHAVLLAVSACRLAHVGNRQQRYNRIGEVLVGLDQLMDRHGDLGKRTGTLALHHEGIAACRDDRIPPLVAEVNSEAGIDNLAGSAEYFGQPLCRQSCGLMSGWNSHIAIMPSLHIRAMPVFKQVALINKEERTALMFECFDRIFGRDLPDLTRRGWRLPHAVVRNAIKVFDRIADELIDPRDLIDGDSDFLAALGRCYSRYRHLLLDRNLVDFAHVQVWADQVLDHEGIANRVADRVGHLMCDEYQDTSYVQERLLMRLARNHGNICVVGDDDQSLYRFRGASVENILRFPHRFDDCTTAELTVNYRSHPDIVRAYDRWMATADWSNPDPRGSPFRYDKVITAHDPRRHHDYPAVIAVDGRGPSDEGRQLAGLLRFLKRQKVIATYDQVVVLLHSVEEEVGGPYLDHLCDAGIPARIVPAGAASRGGRARSEITITTIHQAKGLEWDVVIVGFPGPRQPGRGPHGPIARTLPTPAAFRTGPTHGGI